MSTAGLLPPAFSHGVIALKTSLAGQPPSASLRRVARQLQSQLLSQPLQLSGIIPNPANPSQLLAIGNILGQTVTLPVNLTVTPVGDSHILHLELGPLDLNLLGLRVQLSQVCLDITGTPGTTLGGLLSGLTFPLTLPGQASLLTSLLGQAINPALSQLLSGGHRVSLKGTAPGIQPNPKNSCPILRLQLAPVNLSVLGLNVSLTSCSSNPIILDITALHTGLLGNLLCGLAGM
jgi:hypothetical protein